MKTWRLGVLACLTGLVLACARLVIVTPPRQPDERRGPGPSTAATLGIPPGHLPQPGECRIWIPGTPPGRQPRPRSRSCYGIAQAAPAGSWILYRPTQDRRYVHVRVVDARRPGTVVIVRIFEAETGRFVRDEQPQDDQGPADRPRQERPILQRPPDITPPADRPQDQRPPENRGREELGIPPGHLPQPGECRIWIPGTPPGQQRYRPSGDCDAVTRDAPPGSWIVYRPTDDKRLIHVRVVDVRRPGTIVIVRIFDAESGRFVRDEQPQAGPGPAGMPREQRPVIQRPPPSDVTPPADRPQEQRPAENKPREERPAIQRPPPDVTPPAERPPSPERRPAENKPREERPAIQRPPPDVTPPAERPPSPEQRPAENKPREERPQDQRPPENRGREEPAGPSTAVTLSIPPGQLPEPGECRIWMPGAPPGQQRRQPSGACDAVAQSAPAGSWIVYRPTDDKKVVHVRVVDTRRAGVVVRVQIFDIDSGRLLREENP